MASITSWIRLEPRARDRDMVPGVEARVHDPLWLLARQSQLGELDGEDGGSAIVARARFDVGRIRAYQPRGGDEIAWDGRTPPAALVEGGRRDAPRPIVDLQRRAQTGRHLLRLLAADRHATHDRAFLDAFPIAIPPDGLDEPDRRFLAAVQGRVPDGVRCAAALRASLPGLPPELNIPPGQTSRVSEVCTRWLGWYDALEASSPQPAWQPDRLEYAFALRTSLAGEDVSLAAAEHHGGDLGWWRFDAELGAAAPSEPPGVSTSIPGPVAYRGMPARRYWELEDGAVDWGAVDAGPGDVARMLLVDFALVFSDDWLQIPIDLDAASVARVTSLVVTDTFGVRTVIRAAHRVDGPASPWRLFTPSGAADPFLVVLPTPTVLEGPPLDDVTFAKDELSNVAWAIERRVARADGAGREIPIASVGETAASGSRYRLGTRVPKGWYPYRSQRDATALIRASVPGEATMPLTQLVAETATF